MHDIEVHPLKLDHTAVYTHIVIACDGPKIRMSAKSYNTAMTTDLMVMLYMINARLTVETCLDYV